MLNRFGDVNNSNYTDKYSNSDKLCCFGYERVYYVLASVLDDTRWETKFLKSLANHSRLTPPQRAAYLVVFKISIHLCRSRSEKLNRHHQRSTSSSVLSKSSNSQDHLFWAWGHPHSSPHFLSGILLWHMRIVVSLPSRRKTASSDYAPGRRNQSSSKPNKLNKI